VIGVEIKELDVVLLKDGRKAVILEIFEAGKAFLTEVVDDQGVTLDTPTITEDDIEKITYHA
jgi:hypothetical protein